MTRGGGIRHEPFFALLGKSAEDSERWPAFLAALVTLRLIDEWLVTRYAPSEMVTAVETTIATIPAANPSRQLIGNLLAPILRHDEPDIRAVAAPLFDYARWLHETKHWALADDVYTMVWHGLMNRAGITTEDLDRASEAALYAGACRRNAGDSDAADAAYAAARVLATELGDEPRMRRAELGQAKVAHRRGNLPAAEAALRALIARTKDIQAMEDVYAHACHDLGVTLFNREEYDNALRAYREALAHTKPRAERFRVLTDIGNVLGEIGCIPEARIAALAVLRNSEDLELQGVAGINLIELARLEKDRAEVFRYRAAVEERLDRLPMNIQVDFHFTMGLAFETFNDRESARAQYTRAIELAETHGLGHELYKCDCALDALVDGLSNVEEPMPPPPLESLTSLRATLEEAAAAP